MTRVQVISKTFTNDKGDMIPYKTLAIVGNIGGQTHTLELKVNKTEAMLAEMLLSSKEELNTNSRKANGSELAEFSDNIKKGNDDFDLDDPETDTDNGLFS